MAVLTPLALARQSLSITQNKLSDLTGLSQAWISKAESNDVAIPSERAGALAAALEFNPSLFSIDPQSISFGPIVHHRKRTSMAAKHLSAIEARLHLAGLFGTRLLELAHAAPPADLQFEISPLEGPEEAATATRSTLGLGDGPIPDLLGPTERAGAIVMMSDFGTTKLDALSTRSEDGRAVFLMNSAIPADRLRFTFAHELGHHVMHWRPALTPEPEADRFASELLMPEPEIRADLSNPDLLRLEALKAKWQVSMAALLRRARDLGSVDERKYKSLTIEMSRFGMRASEPGEFKAEQPKLMSDVINELTSKPDGWANVETASLATRSQIEGWFL